MVEAANLLRRHNVLDLYSFAVSYAALGYAMSGSLVEARRWLDLYDDELREGEQKTTVVADRAAVWIAAQGGDLEHAERILVESAGEVVEHSPLYAQPLYHDAVRLVRSEPAAQAVIDCVSRLDAPLPTALAEHASATLDANPTALVNDARRFERFGVWQLAAEAFTEASHLSGDDGLVAEADRLAHEQIVSLPRTV